jgi:hypothetical protein
MANIKVQDLTGTNEVDLLNDSGSFIRDLAEDGL